MADLRVEQESAVESEAVRHAACLGWAMVELDGWFLRHSQVTVPGKPVEDRPFSAYRYPSHGRSASPAMQLMSKAQRLHECAQQMASHVPRLDNAPIQGVTDEVSRFLQTAGADEDCATTELARSVHRKLERWANQALLALEARSGLLGRSFHFGMGLSRTYWGLSQWRDRDQPPPKQGTWLELLEGRRISELVRTARRLEPQLPDGVGVVLRSTVWQWGIAGEVARKGDALYIPSRRTLYAFRSVPVIGRIARLARSWTLKDRKKIDIRDVPKAFDQRLHVNLERQARVWADVLFQRRLPSEYLKPTDWRWAKGLSWAMLMLLISLLVYSAYWLAPALLYVFRALLSLIPTPVGFDSRWSVATATVAAVVALVPVLRKGVAATGAARQQFEHWIVAQRIASRTLRSWSDEV